MDGVIINSELYWDQIDAHDMYGYTFTNDMERDIIGLNQKDIIAYLETEHGLEIDSEYVTKQELHFGEKIYGQQAQLCEGVAHLIDVLYQKGIALAVASSSQKKWIDRTLIRFGLQDKFQLRMSTMSDTLPGKPDPSIYYETMKRLQVEPEDTVIIEDSYNGFTAAKASGARVIAVPHDLTKHGNFEAADLRVDSLADSRVLEFFSLN